MAYTGKCELFDDEQGGGDRGDDVAADAFVDGGVSSRLDAGSIIDDGGSNGNGKPVSERTEAYRDFFERITSDDSIRYALEMCVRDATAVSDDQLADGVLTACSGCPTRRVFTRSGRRSWRSPACATTSSSPTPRLCRTVSGTQMLARSRASPITCRSLIPACATHSANELLLR